MNDKVQHFIAGFILSGFGIIFTPLIILGFIFGIGKEIYDKYSGKGVVELKDVIATFLGALCSTIIVLILFYLFKI